MDHYLYCPAYLLKCAKSPYEVLFLGTLNGLSSKTGSCWASVARLAEYCMCSDRQIQLMIKKFVDMGVIATEAYTDRNGKEGKRISFCSVQSMKSPEDLPQLDTGEVDSPVNDVHPWGEARSRTGEARSPNIYNNNIIHNLSCSAREAEPEILEKEPHPEPKSCLVTIADCNLSTHQDIATGKFYLKGTSLLAMSPEEHSMLFKACKSQDINPLAVLNAVLGHAEDAKFKGRIVAHKAWAYCQQWGFETVLRNRKAKLDVKTQESYASRAENLKQQSQPQLRRVAREEVPEKPEPELTPEEKEKAQRDVLEARKKVDSLLGRTASNVGGVK